MLHGPNFGPPVEGDNYKLAGGGWADLYADRIELSGHSDIYGISPDENHAREISDLTGRKVEVNKPKPVAIEREVKPIANLDDEWF